MGTSARSVGALALGIILTTAACSGSAAPVDEALARDLERINGSAFELAPAATGTQVMSELEQSPKAPAATPAPAPTRARVAQSAPKPRQQSVRTPTAAPQAPQQAAAPAPEPVESFEPAPSAVTRPSSAPQGAGPPPPGGWRNVNDVIRNSRVPITP